jgi:hypothetical protein
MWIEAAVAACQLKAGTAEPRGLHGFHFLIKPIEGMAD